MEELGCNYAGSFRPWLCWGTGISQGRRAAERVYDIGQGTQGRMHSTQQRRTGLNTPGGRGTPGRAEPYSGTSTRGGGPDLALWTEAGGSQDHQHTNWDGHPGGPQDPLCPWDLHFHPQGWGGPPGHCPGMGIRRGPGPPHPQDEQPGGAPPRPLHPWDHCAPRMVFEGPRTTAPWTGMWRGPLGSLCSDGAEAVVAVSRCPRPHLNLLCSALALNSVKRHLVHHLALQCDFQNVFRSWLVFQWSLNDMHLNLERKTF